MSPMWISSPVSGPTTKSRSTTDACASTTHNAAQPCLIVNDLKLDPRTGAVALWIGPGTEGYFSNLKITPK